MYVHSLCVLVFFWAPVFVRAGLLCKLFIVWMKCKFLIDLKKAPEFPAPKLGHMSAHAIFVASC